jgi:protein-S-isoprenylcysteine O-methyltransferase Ste14
VHRAKPSRGDWLFMWVYGILMSLPIPMAFLFYNHYGLTALVYLGWLLMCAGLVINLFAAYAFRTYGGVPEGERMVNTTRLVDQGIYAVVRHPQYLGFIWITLGIVPLSQHWLSVICGVVGCLLFIVDIRKEERNNVERFGEAYREYMERVPGLNLLSGLLRWQQRPRS